MLSTSEFQPTDKLEGDTTTCQRPALIADTIVIYFYWSTSISTNYLGNYIIVHRVTYYIPIR